MAIKICLKRGGSASIFFLMVAPLLIRGVLTLANVSAKLNNNLNATYVWKNYTNHTLHKIGTK